ncbi:hypothetical protein PR202_gb18468 [Eleusine coracana subsp. coracana]|uniref:Calcium-binding EF hand family protein n=1 Tax=Eleusine coracana subsp. coracana TaxID=191504 RepID=A0AAV5F4Z6_ELECO|nr:hypothetical protein PR202_gb18468 [Eleusine coracana subsp. coracana]
MAGMEAFEVYFRRADLNQDGRISGQEAVAFFQGANLPQQVLAQVWMHADQNKTGLPRQAGVLQRATRLVTVAQSGRQLTPDIVQSALYGPAAARIPAPKINMGPAPPQMGAAGASRPQGSAAMTPVPGQVGAGQMNPAAVPRPQGSGMMPTSAQVSTPQVNPGAAPRPQGINSMMPAASQGAAMQATQFAGPRAMQQQPPSMGFNQQQPPSSTGFMRPPQVGASATSLQAQSPGINQSQLGGGSMGISVGWQGGNVGSVGGAPQPTPGGAAPSQTARSGFGLGLSSTMGMAPVQQTQGLSSSPLPPQSNSVVPPQDSKALVLSGNGPANSSGANTDIFSALTQPKPSVSAASALPSSTLPSSSSFMSTPTGSQNLTNLTQIGALQGSSQPQQTQPITKPSVPAQTALGSSGVSNSASQWPKVAQSDIQKYMKVFGDVDRDRDGKITGSEARTLFLSWRLPRGWDIPVPMANAIVVFVNLLEILKQVNRDDRSGVNPVAQEVPDAPKKVEVEKQVLDSREKLEYYRSKMQDLVLYKSRCDNRLNEITERASSDKREVESLAKKYEEKYKQVAELASKLAVEEHAFRDVQERKVELHDALIKMVQGGSVDGLLQVRADRIQHQLEEMERALSERCKHFGLQFKSSASVELPSGWEPGPQEGCIEWDEDWDKFEDEGFGIVKDNGTIHENPVSAENTKVPSLWDDGDDMSPVASSNGHIKDEKRYSGGDHGADSEIGYDFGDESVRSPGSAGRSASGSPFKPSRFGMHDTSPSKRDSYSDHGGSESVFGDKFADETAWSFDDQDTESVWGSSALNTEADHRGGTQNSFFGSEVGSPSGASVFGGMKRNSFFDDSVPSTPAYTSGFSPKFSEIRDDSSSYNFGRFDSFRSQDSGFPQESRFSRFDSISSSKGDNMTGFDTGNSSRDFGRFDSFDDSDPFGSSGPFKASGSRSPPKF